EQALKDQEQDDEIEELNDQRLVEADQASAFVAALARRPRDAWRQQHQQDDDARDGADPFPFTLTHSEVSSISRCPTQVCENYHAIPLAANRRAGDRPSARSPRLRPPRRRRRTRPTGRGSPRAAGYRRSPPRGPRRARTRWPAPAGDCGGSSRRRVAAPSAAHTR